MDAQNVAQFSGPEVKSRGTELLEAALLSYSKLDDLLLSASQVRMIIGTVH